MLSDIKKRESILGFVYFRIVFLIGNDFFIMLQIKLFLKISFYSSLNSTIVWLKGAPDEVLAPFRSFHFRVGNWAVFHI